MKCYQATPKAKINTGLDDKIFNSKIATEREKRREKSLKYRMQNPLLYPTGKTTLRD